MRFPSLFSAGSLLAVVLAGCVGTSPGEVADVVPEPDPTPVDTGNLTDQNVTEGGRVLDENVTRIGGAHAHDYWDGATDYEIMDRVVNHGSYGAPACVNAALVGPCAGGVERVRFEVSDDPNRPNNVWPGAARLEVTLEFQGTLVAPLEFRYRMPNSGFSDCEGHPKTKITKSPFTISFDVEEKHTDPPHWSTSLWYFCLATSPQDGAPSQSRTGAFVGNVRWSATIFRSERELPIDDAHPDLWEQDLERVLIETTRNHDALHVQAPGEQGSLQQRDYSDTALKVEDGSQVLPGTARMVIELDWRGTMTPAGTKLKLGLCPIQADSCDTGRYYAPWWYPEPTEDGTTTRSWEIEVRPEWWDSPYAQKTLWRFRWAFDSGDAEEVLGQTGEFKGEVDWKVTAYKIAS